MSTCNHSIHDLRDLLNDLENLTNYLSCDIRYLSPEVIHGLQEAQLDLVQRCSSYALVLSELDPGRQTSRLAGRASSVTQ